MLVGMPVAVDTPIVAGRLAVGVVSEEKPEPVGDEAEAPTAFVVAPNRSGELRDESELVVEDNVVDVPVGDVDAEPPLTEASAARVVVEALPIQEKDVTSVRTIIGDIGVTIVVAIVDEVALSAQVEYPEPGWQPLYVQSKLQLLSSAVELLLMTTGVAPSIIPWLLPPLLLHFPSL